MDVQRAVDLKTIVREAEQPSCIGPGNRKPVERIECGHAIWYDVPMDSHHVGRMTNGSRTRHHRYHAYGSGTSSRPIGLVSFGHCIHLGSFRRTTHPAARACAVRSNRVIQIVERTVRHRQTSATDAVSHLAA